MYPFRKLFTIFVVSFALLVVGRNLTFLPRVAFVYNEATAYNTDLVKQNIKKLTEEQKGHYSVLFRDLQSPTTFGLNENTMLTGASVNKVHIVTALYYLANKGKVNLDQKITVQKKDIQNYGTGSLRYQKPGQAYSLRTLAKLALQQSDNTATYIIANRIGRDTVQEIMSELGLTQTNMEDNKTSLTDIALLFQKIYVNDVASPALTKELLNFMENTDIENRLPLQLPDGVIVAHKTGDAVGGVHDVGIIMDGDTAYFLGVLTSDVGGAEEQTATTIATISKMVYDFAKSQE